MSGCHETNQVVPAAALAACFVLACAMQAALPGPWVRCAWTVLVFGAVLFCALVDARYRIVPNAAVAILCLLGLARAAAPAVLRAGSVSDALAAAGIHAAGAAALAAFMLVLSFAFERRGREGMGGGDVKLMFALALCFGVEAAFAMLGLACVIVLAFQACRALWLRGCKQGSPTLRSTVAFAPAIALAVWLIAVFLP